MLSIVAAVMAVMAGVRPGIWKMAEPSLSFSVCAPSHVSTVAVSDPYASAAQTESKPAASASRTISSCSEAVSPRPQYPTFRPRRMLQLSSQMQERP